MASGNWKAGSREAGYYAAGYWRDEDLWTSFARTAARHPGKAALIADGRSISFGELAAMAAGLGSGLCAQGIGPGDVVLIHGRNTIEATAAMLACAHAGAVMTPVPPMYSVAQLTGVGDNARAKVMIGLGEPRECERTLAAARACQSVRLVVVPDACLDGGSALGWSALPRPAAPHVPVDADALALMAYSSGTTGTPKGVMHAANTVRYTIEQRTKLHGVTADDTILVVSQFGFVGSSVFGLLLGTLLGTTAVLMRSWDPEAALRLIEAHRVGYAHFMATHTHDILACPALATANVSSFRRGAMGGLSRQQRQEAIDRFCPRPLPGYGMSECLGNSTCAIDDDIERVLSRDGRPYPGTELRIVDAEDRPVPAGTTGEIQARGPSRCLGYFEAEQLNREAFTEDGYFRTGDLGWLDGDRYVTFAGRAKEVIRRGGVSFAPADLEATLRGHPRIRDIAVVGLPDPRLGERACACIISKDGAAITIEELTSFLQAKDVARYMWPERVVAFQEFPRTPSLKVQKRGLVEEIARRDGAAA